MNTTVRAILRNLSLVPDERIEEAIAAPRGTVATVRMIIGLEDLPVNPDWVKRGFVSIIRQNWDLLDEDQIVTLLGMTEAEYHSVLTDYDFLDIKLGEKPQITRPVYEPLTAEDEAELREVKVFLTENRQVRLSQPFDFYRNEAPSFRADKAPAIPERFLAGYAANYHGALLDDDLPDYSDEMLERVKNSGATGIWIHETLRTLTPFPFDESLSQGWEKRLENLKKLTERAAKHGVDIYLYLNEPRSLPPSFFERYPSLRGAKCENGDFCLCTSTEEVRDYLYNAVLLLAKTAPKLHAILTITMSENPTHCYAKPLPGLMRQTDCPRCASRLPEEVAAEVNNIIASALRDAGGTTRLLANLWGWSDFMGWTFDEVKHGIDCLSPDIDVLCVSEYSKDFVRGGVPGRVIDYSISVVGPSETTVNTLRYAKKKGHRVFAKAQINNSWECSAVPYLPAFGLMTEHIRALTELGVSGIMLGWSLGGYPGGALPLCNAICVDPTYDEKRFYEETFGADAETIRSAVSCFDRAFADYPFSVDSIYFGGQTLGPANRVSRTVSDRRSTMVCFTFDDYENYTQPYGIDVYLSLYEKLLAGWEEGLSILASCRDEEKTKQFVTVAKAAYIHLKSDYLIARLAKCKRQNRSEEIDGILAEMYGLTRDLYALTCADATIGFEMSNHYYYTPNRLLEQMWDLSHDV